MNALTQLLKVLIADDEPMIREGIRYTIAWDELGIEVAGEAEDGEEALELAISQQIDLLLADLNMPIMNGLTLIKNIRKSLPDCRVIIISGYDEFRYVQEALRMQVDDYILKPIQPDNLTEVIKKACKELLQQKEQRKFIETASNQLLQNTQLLQEKFCQNWLQGGIPIEKIKEQLSFWNLPEKNPNVLAVVRSQELESKQPLITETDKELLVFGIKNIVMEILEREKNLVFSDHHGLVFILLWGEASDELYLTMEKSIQTYLDIAITISSVHPAVDEELSLVFESLLRMLHEEVPVSPIVRRAKNFITEHYTDPDLTLELVAQQLQVSPVYLSRTIKQELGTSFVSLMTQKRMEKAIRLLHTTDLQMVEIAEETGYASQHYFSTAFKKYVGVSPNQYRKGLSYQNVGN